MRVVIVDDERLARDRLRQLLAAHSNVRVVGEADAPGAAAELIERARPDVVFLDIEMRDGTGFDVVERASAPFHTIFVTAYAEHAARAFDVRATDYLLKPVTAERLSMALERFAQDPICLMDGHKPRFVPLRNIVSITAAGPYTEVRTTAGAVILVHRSTQSWEAMLPATTFRRVHRSAIVNLDHVVDADRAMTGGYRLTMRSGPPIFVSRRHAAQFRRRRH
jgi:two-component system LytT family response regulator